MNYLTNPIPLKRLVFIALFTFTTVVFSQNYEKTYRQSINFNTGTNNGKDVTVNFAVKYDAFMGEPLRSSLAKVVSEGNFIMYNGKRYYRNEIGDEVFNRVKLSTVNVSYDIYQGSSKVTTVSLSNQISVSFIPGSPDWDDLWPGVSEERAKQLFKDGYSIRNARLYDVKFSGFSAIESYLKKKEEEKQRQEFQEAIQNVENMPENSLEEVKAKYNAYKELDKTNCTGCYALKNDYRSEKNRLSKAITDMENEAKKKEEEANNEDSGNDEDETENESNENETVSSVNTYDTDDDESEDTSDDETESAKSNSKEQRQQERLNAYNDRIASQQRENNAIAASAAASSVGLLYILGGVIYSNMGLPADDLFTGDNFFLNLDFGYGVTHFPLAFRSVVQTGPDTIKTSNETRNAVTINLRLALRLGYEMEYAGGNIFGRFEPGFSPLFTDFNTSFGYGAEVFGGHKNFKLYGRYEMGTHSFSSNNWLDAEDVDSEGKTSTSYQQIRVGLKFSYYRNDKTAKRDHITLGIMENYFDEDSADIFSIRESPDKPILNLLSTPSDADENPYVATGFFFEWKRDHTHRLYVELFPNYPVTGEVGGSQSDGGFFVQVGFSRSIESFFKF